MKRIKDNRYYFDAFLNGLVEVSDPVLVPDYRPHIQFDAAPAVLATIVKTVGAYKAGQRIDFPPRDLVRQIGHNSVGFIMVRTVPAPRTQTNAELNGEPS